jgi:hypothetical protein
MGTTVLFPLGALAKPRLAAQKAALALGMVDSKLSELTPVLSPAGSTN